MEVVARSDGVLVADGHKKKSESEERAGGEGFMAHGARSQGIEKDRLGSKCPPSQLEQLVHIYRRRRAYSRLALLIAIQRPSS